MDLISITRFESISKDLHRIEDKLKQSGVQSLELKFKINGDNEESYTLYNSEKHTDNKNDQSPISTHFFPTTTTPHEHHHHNRQQTTPLTILHPKVSPPRPTKNHSKRSILLKICYQAYRGFSIGFLGKLLFNFLPLIIKKGPLSLFTEMTLKRCFNPAWWGLFSSSFLVIFHGTMHLTKKSQDLTKHQRSFISAFLAAWSMLFLPSNDRPGVAVFMFVRALETLARASYEAGILPYIPHADSLLFAISTAQIVFCWIYQPWAIDKSYGNFLSTHTGNRAQGTQQALAYLHINAPVHSTTSAVTIGENTMIQPHQNNIVSIPGGHLEGVKMGYAKVKDWQHGLNVGESIQFYKRRSGGGGGGNGVKFGQNEGNDVKNIISAPSTIDTSLTTVANPTTTTTTTTISPQTASSYTTSILTTPLISILTSPAAIFSAQTPQSTISSSLINPSLLKHHRLSPLDTEYSAYLPQMQLTNAPIAQRPSLNSILPEELVQTCNKWHHTRNQAPLLPQVLTDRHKLICQILHPECPGYCIGGQLKAYPGVLKQGIKTYAPVYIIPALLFRYQTLFSDPENFFSHIILSTLQSASFFSNMTFLSHVFSCYARLFLLKIGSRYAFHYYLMPGMTGLAAFIALLGEQKSKRIELALFSLSHAVRSITKLLLVSERIPLIPWASTALFATSIAVLISAAMSNPMLLRPSYFSLLRHYLGRDTPGLATVHTLSNMTQLLDLDDVGATSGGGNGECEEGIEIDDCGGQKHVLNPQKQSLNIIGPNSPNLASLNSTQNKNNVSLNQAEWIKDVVAQDLALNLTPPVTQPSSQTKLQKFSGQESGDKLDNSNNNKNVQKINDKNNNNQKNNPKNNNNQKNNPKNNQKNNDKKNVQDELKHIESFSLFSPTSSENGSDDKLGQPSSVGSQYHNNVPDHIRQNGHNTKNQNNNIVFETAPFQPQLSQNDISESQPEQDDLAIFHQLQRRVSTEFDSQPLMSPVPPQ